MVYRVIILDDSLKCVARFREHLCGSGQFWLDCNRDFSRILEDLGIDHEAEEYAGNPFDKTWTDNGRFYARLLPFINQHVCLRVQTP